MRIGAKRSEFQAAQHGLKSEWIDANRIENKLAAKVGREKVIDFRDAARHHQISTSAANLRGYCFCKMPAIFMRLSRQDR